MHDFQEQCQVLTGDVLWMVETLLQHNAFVLIFFKTIDSVFVISATSFPEPFPWLGGGKRLWERGCDIRNNQGLSRCYQPRPKADNTYLDRPVDDCVRNRSEEKSKTRQAIICAEILPLHVLPPLEPAIKSNRGKKVKKESLKFKRIAKISVTSRALLRNIHGWQKVIKTTELKNDCACVTSDPVGESSARQLARKYRLEQHISNERPSSLLTSQ